MTGVPGSDRERGRVECDGGPHCQASPHVHGCFADKGDCDEPSEHPGRVSSRAGTATDRADAEARAYYFSAYVRVEAASEEAAWERIRGESIHVPEADVADADRDGEVQLVIDALLEAVQVAEPGCICPPDLVARGGFKGGCPVHG